MLKRIFKIKRGLDASSPLKCEPKLHTAISYSICYHMFVHT